MSEPRVSDIVITYSEASVTLRCYEWVCPTGSAGYEAARLRIEVIDAVNVPKEIFVWEQHRVFTEAEVKNKDRFLCVAKVSDLSVYPVGVPDTQSSIPPFYRLSVFDVPFSSPDDYVDTFTRVKYAISQLLKVLVELGLTNEQPYPAVT